MHHYHKSCAAGSPCRIFGIANLTSNGEIPQKLDVMPLSSLCCLAFIQENRDALVINGIVKTLAGPCHTAKPVIQREVASCFSKSVIEL
jgi:hypothetical protein